MKRSLLLALSLAALAPASVRAGGLYAGDNGTQAAQRAGAFVAKADDPTALYHNPAGLVKARRFQFFLGGNFVTFKQEYQRSGDYPDNDPAAPEQHAWAGSAFPSTSTSEFKAIPSVFASQNLLGGRLSLGEGIFAPMGMPNRHYATGHPDVAGSTPGDQAPGPQRYDVVEQEGLVLFPSLGAAYRVHDLIDVGGRFSWGFGTIQGESDVWAVGNGSEDPGRDGVFHFDVTDYTLFQWSLGVLVRPTPNVELGAMYASKVAVRAKGTSYAVLGEWVTNPAPGLMTSVTPTGPSESDCKPNEMGTPAELNTCINFDLPMRANAGARLIQRDVDGRERGDLELDVRWEQWSTAKDVGVIVDGQDELTQINLKEVALRHGFRDTWSFLLGGSWRFDMGEHALIGRAGAGYELGAAPHQWTRLDYDGLSRIVVGLGAGYELANFRIDAGINYFQGLGRDVKTLALPAGCMRTDCHPQPSPTQPLEVRGQQDYHPFNAGRYDARYVIGTVGVTAWY